MGDLNEAVLDALLAHAHDALAVVDAQGRLIRRTQSAAGLVADGGGLLPGVPSATLQELGNGLRLVRLGAPADQRLTTFLEHLPAAVLLRDTQGRICALNRRAAEGLAVPAADAIGRSLEEAGGRRFVDADADRLALESPDTVVTDAAWGEGAEARHYRAIRFRLPGDAGGPPLLAAVFQDVTAQRAAQAQLRESEARLAAFMDHAPVAMYLKEVGGRYVVVNRRMDEVVVSGVGEILGRTTREVFNPIAAEFIEAADRRVVENGAPEVGEEHYAGAEDFQYTFTTRFPVRDAAGVTTHIGGVLIDTTPLKRAERRVLETEQRLSAFLSHAPFGMFLKDSRGELLVANPEMARIAEQGAPFVDGDSEEEISGREAEVIASGEPQVTEWRRPGRGAYEWTLAVRFPAPGEGGMPHLGGFVLDISDRKAAEAELASSREALHQSEKVRALGSLLAGVSHELNNPLSAVLGNAIMLEEDLADTPLGARAERIRVAAARCARIVQVFLAMARQKAPHRTWVRLSEVIADVLEITSYGLRIARVTTALALEEGLPDVWVDPDQLHQVLVNLVVNAQQVLEGRDGAREIRITARVAKAEVWLEVEDTGPGIAPDEAARIFEPFYTTKPQGAGTGLGLSVSQGIMETHGGALELVPGKGGARFRIRLPLAGPETAETAAPVPEYKLTPGRALVVEDDADVAATLSEFLRRDGFVVEWVAGPESLTAIERADHDVILCDLKTPALDGPPLLAWLRRIRPDLVNRVGFVTADLLGPATHEFLSRSGRPYAEKPFTRVSVRRMISEIRTFREERASAQP